MSRFDVILATDGLPILRQMFGEDAVYTRRAGVQINTWVIHKTDLGFAGQRNIQAETALSVEIPVADLLTDPQPGDSVLFLNRTYRVDQLLDNDGLFYRIAIR